MKIHKLKISTGLLFITAMMFACKKDNDIRISRLDGTWSTTRQTSSVKYKFNNTDKIVTILSNSSSNGADTLINRKFMISYDNRVMTIYKEIYREKENEIFTGQYNITKLSNKELLLKNTDKERSDQELAFVKQ